MRFAGERAGRGQGAAAAGLRKPEQLVVDYAGDPDGCHRVIAALTKEYERYVESEHALCPGCPVVRAGPFIVYSMLEWKAIYSGGGRLGHWTRSDIHEYLLDHYPRKVSADRRLVEATPTCVRDFVYFMSDRGTFGGEDLDALADAADEVFDDFVAANRDRRNWGLAKSALHGGAAAMDGADRPAIGMAGGPSPTGPARAPARSGQPSASARRKKGKAARSARRRNRR